MNKLQHSSDYYSVKSFSKHEKSPVSLEFPACELLKEDFGVAGRIVVNNLDGVCAVNAVDQLLDFTAGFYTNL